MHEVSRHQAAHLPATDFDVHGIVGVRLLQATNADVARVERQLGPMRRPLTRQPDITVRFVDEVQTGDLRWVEFGRTGFTGRDFFVLEDGRPARIDFETVGTPGFEIVCQRGMRRVPLLMAFVTLTALQRRHVALHASAFVHDGTGILVTGWAKGGKTEALLAFAAHGATYVGDEWILLSEDGARMHGIPEFIRVQDWHVNALPTLRRHVPLTERMLFRGIRWMDGVHGRLPQGRVGRMFPLRLLGRAMPALRRQLNIQLDPARLFDDARSFTASPDKVFFMTSHSGTGTSVERIHAQEVCDRMVASLRYEYLPLTQAYLAYQFAFPHRRSQLLDRCTALQTGLLSGALARKEAYIVRHPYPCDLPALFAAMAPACVSAAITHQEDVR
jgi:hypothetical protein